MINSIAKIVKEKGSSKCLGTAFLIRVEQDIQYWMTCHHVIMTLDEIYINICRNNNSHEYICAYDEKYSDPNNDLAIFCSKISMEDLKNNNINPILIGLYSNFNAPTSFHGCGFKFIENCRDDFPEGERFSGNQPKPQRLRLMEDSIKTPINQNNKPWQKPLPQKTINILELEDTGDRITGGMSGSPVCIELNGAEEKFLCIGILHANRTKNKTTTHGYVLPFAWLAGEVLSIIPFNRYAHCVALTLAATNNELQTKIQPQTKSIEYTQDHYGKSRDDWRPFGKRSIEILLKNLINSTHIQSASAYIGTNDLEFINYIEDRELGPLIIIIDPVSFKLGLTKKFFTNEITTKNRNARYIIIIKDSSVSQVCHEGYTNLREGNLGWLWSPDSSRRRRNCSEEVDLIVAIEEEIEKIISQHTRKASPYTTTRPAGNQSLMSWE